MNCTKLIAASAILATLTFGITVPAGAAGRKAGHGAASVHAAASSFRGGNMGNQSWRRNNRRFTTFQSFPYGYGYGYGGYGNAVYLNPDEADWSEQWQSLYQDNDGPYARSAHEGNPLGGARIWEIPEK
jgi:hypothetical protein